MIFLSSLLGADVVDVDQKSVGSVRDLLVRMREPFPVITAIVLRGHGKLPSTIAWSCVRTGANREVSLNIHATQLVDYASADNDVWLSRDILDKQIVDTDGRRIVRVNDLQLQERGRQLILVGVDVGARGLLRRVGMERGIRRISHLLGRDFPQRVIPWDTVDPLESDERSVKLRISHRKLAKMHPADIADIVEQLGGRDRAAIFASLDDETAAEIIEEAEGEVQAQILERLGDERAADILEAMSPDEAADILGELPEERREQLLGKMQHDEAEDIGELLAYEDDTAGGLMTTEFVSVPGGSTAAEAIERLRELQPDLESVYYIYVVSPDEHLTGVITLRNLVLAAPETTAIQLMNERILTVRVDTSAKEVAAIIAKYNLLAVPVLNEDDELQGIVTIDDAMDAIMSDSIRRKARAL